MHQDVPYFEHEAHSMIAAVVHFDESTIEKGCIRVVPGSWKRGRMDHIGEGGHHLEVEEFPVEQATPCEAEPGDVLFFSYLCIRKCSRPLCVFFPKPQRCCCRRLDAQPPSDQLAHIGAHPAARPCGPIAQAGRQQRGPLPQLARPGHDPDGH